MRIIIIGCGKVGGGILKKLSGENHEIIVLDNNPEVIRAVQNEYDVMALCAEATDFAVLDSMDIRRADLLIATSDSDEVNMLCCFIAKKLDVKHVLARIRDTEYTRSSLSFLKKEMDIDMIVNPDYLTAEAIYRGLKLPAAVKVENFSDGRLVVSEVIVEKTSGFCGRSLIDARRAYPFSFLIGSVTRNNDFFIPKGDFVLAEGDRISLVAEGSELSGLLKAAGFPHREPKNIILVGASRISVHLSELLCRDGKNIKLIEKDRERCEKLRERLPAELAIVNADATQQDLLSEEGVESCDALVSLTSHDEDNIMLSFFAKKCGVPKVITKVNQSNYAELCEDYGLDTPVSAKSITSDFISGYVRELGDHGKNKVKRLYTIGKGNASAVEFLVSENFKALDTRLKDMKIRRGLLLVGIIRDGSSIIPCGSDKIYPGDRVVVLSEDKGIKDLNEILVN